MSELLFTSKVKAGSGTKIHAAWKRSGGRHYTLLCGAVNTHNINRPVHARPVSNDEPVTCARCLAAIAAHEELVCTVETLDSLTSVNGDDHYGDFEQAA